MRIKTLATSINIIRLKKLKKKVKDSIQVYYNARHEKSTM